MSAGFLEQATIARDRYIAHFRNVAGELLRVPTCALEVLDALVELLDLVASTGARRVEVSRHDDEDA
jgi:hypothetical protein